MPLGNGSLVSTESEVLEEYKNVPKNHIVVDRDNEGVETLEGLDFTKYVEVEYLTPEQAKKLAAEVLAEERPVDYSYIERMKKEGVSEALAVGAFKGRFGGNESRTKFFLNSKFYYGSDAPTPLDRLIKAVEEDTMPECIEMLEGTKDGLDRGDHF